VTNRNRIDYHVDLAIPVLEPLILRSTMTGYQARLLFPLIFVATLPLAPRANAQPAETEKATFRLEETSEPAGWKIMHGDKVVAGYIQESAGRPVIYPVVGPGGHHMTRAYPLEEARENERSDHPHHKSMWLTHGDVNGTDFWLDRDHAGKIMQKKGSASVDDRGAAVVVTENDWVTKEGEKVLSDTRRVAFSEQDGRYIIDCDFLLKATDGDVNFGDTKEGSFGIRVAGTMKVDAKLGGKVTNAEGQVNKEAWGQKSPWVDYSGPVDGDTVGITIHDHPSSFGHPCRWHVRTYGLFAANPFGVHHFTNTKKTNGIVLKDGSEMRLNYRVVLYQGEFDADAAAEDSKQYANDPRPELK
jgi:hypothetical protein